MYVSDILQDVKEILGNSDMTTVFRRLTDAITVLSNKQEARFDPLIGLVDICTARDEHTITLPRYVDTPLAVNVGGQPVYFRNRWYEFHLNGFGSRSPSEWAWDDKGDVPVIQDIVLPSNLIAVADLATDLGSTIRVFGFDQNDKWIITQNPDGAYQDGFLVPINLASDFPNGIITPDSNRLFIRNYTVPSIQLFNNPSGQNFTTGEAVVVSQNVAPFPTPLVNGGTYYTRFVDANTVTLHNTRDGANSNTDIVTITGNISNTTSLNFNDTRTVVVNTEFTTSTPHNMTTGSVVSFTATTLPVPLLASQNYFANVIDPTHFTAHTTLSDALAGINPINCSTTGSVDLMSLAKRPIFPVTTLKFSVNHDFATGDQIQASNSTGTLPIPLQASVFYYAYVVDSKTITIHNTFTDAQQGINPILLTTNGTGANIVFKTLNASVSTGSSSNITAVNHGLSAGDFVQFATTGTFPSPIVQNTTYQVANPSSTNSFTLADTSGNPINITALGSGQLQLVISRVFTIGFNNTWAVDTSNLTTGDVMQFATTGTLPATNPTIGANTNYYLRVTNSDVIRVYTTNAYALDTAVRLTSTRALSSNVVTIVTQSNHNLNTGDYVDVTGVASTLNGVLTGVTVASGGTGWAQGNPVTITDGTSHTATGTVNVAHGLLASITITNGGTGWTTGNTATITDAAANTATATVTASAGVITAFSISVPGTGFIVGEALTVTGAGSGGTFSVHTIADGVAIVSISLTNAGSGFTASESLTVTGAGSGGTYTATGVSNNVTNTNNPYIGNRFQITKTNATTFTYSSTGINEPTTTDTNGQVVISEITISSLGAGAHSMVLARSATVTLLNSLLTPLDPTFFLSGAAVTFSSSGILPSPLMTNTTYFGIVVGSQIQINDINNNPVTLTNVGSGTQFMTVSAIMSVTLPTNLTVVNNNYNNGDAVTMGTTGILPTPYSGSVTYYLRNIDANTVEVYDTFSHAQNAPSNTGRITPTNIGTGQQSLIQVIANFLVKKVDRILKSQSNGFISLYAWDAGRTNDITTLGYYYPDELQPRYRRIQVGSKCKWVRVSFRRRVFTINSANDWIPLNNKQSILMMLRSLKFARDNFVDQCQEYDGLAEKYLIEEMVSRQGPDVISVQINQDIFTNPRDQFMDSDQYYGGGY